jgi:hypothetical protein
LSHGTIKKTTLGLRKYPEMAVKDCQHAKITASIGHRGMPEDLPTATTLIHSSEIRTVSVMTAAVPHTAKIIATFKLWRSRDYDRRR